MTKPAKKSKAPAAKKKAKAPLKKNAQGVVLLSGGNPQIAKGEGDGPVQAYIAAIPDWRGAVAAKIDALIVRALPKVRKAVKWNSPFYGIEEKHWIISLHCFDKYVKVAFFRGAELNPPPPESSKQQYVRYFHVREGDEFDEKQFSNWVKQAAKLPGERM